VNALLPRPAAPAAGEAYFAVRELTADDAGAFRALRLTALQKEGRYFAASYDDERKLTDAAWRERCVATRDQCLIGIFKQHELIGVTAAMKWDNDASSRTALFRSSYIRPEERGQGLSSMLFTSRILWAKKDGRFTEALLFHREGHWIAKALKHLGAVEDPSLRRPMQWANGDTADAIWYRLNLG
jgi:GNAT superfamily N-acetyltransferase